MLADLAHRGPDDQGVLVLRHGDKQVQQGGPELAEEPCEVLLAQRRLSVLDTSDAGHQPMSSADGRFHLVYNGEIYNADALRMELQEQGIEFRGTSDTEVLLAALQTWGESVLNRLVGMYSLALLDVQRQQVLLARDPFGIKPLYWTCGRVGDEPIFVFASEPSPLLKVPGVSRQADRRRVAEYLLGIDGGDLSSSFFADIRALPPGHLIRIRVGDSGLPRAHRFWKLQTAPAALTFDQAVKEVRSCFLDAVEKHLRSDVPLGIALSGGIDSSAILMAMRQIAGPHADLHAVSYLARGSSVNEEPWIDLITKEAGAIRHDVLVQPEDLVNDLPEFIRSQGEPVGSTSIFASDCVFRGAQEAGLTVLLSGQGADELFAGYHGYAAYRMAGVLRQGRLGAWWQLSGHCASDDGSSLQLRARSIGLSLPRVVRRRLRSLKTKGAELYPYLDPSWRLKTDSTDDMDTAAWMSGTRLNHRLIDTLLRSSVPDLLRYADRCSMRHSIECRVPFLTTDLANLALSLPDDALIASDGTTKHVFREAIRPFVPDAIVDRSDKLGFPTPESQWMETLSDWVAEKLDSASARDGLPIDLAAIRADFDRVREGRANYSWRFWRVVNLIEWAEIFDVSFSSPSTKSEPSYGD